MLSLTEAAWNPPAAALVTVIESPLPADGVWSPPATPREDLHSNECNSSISSGHDIVGPSSDVWPSSYHEMVPSHVVSAFRNLRSARRQLDLRRVASVLHTMHQGSHV